MPTTNQYPNQNVHTTITIASGQTTSDAVDLRGTTLIAIQMPGSWTSADISFQASIDGSTFYDVYDSQGVAVTYAAGASQLISVHNVAAMAGLRYLKLVSSAAQGADRSLTLISRGI
ncbi:MAG: hypothetical protein H6908_05580 [Hyphomicrobiales bacterium]|nr:hypothetical protein [Hyphomicrobiales bacterium]